MSIENISDKIDLLLSGKITGEEKTQLEILIDNDVKLKAEYDIQYDIINGIKNQRIAMLKANLNSIQMPSIANSTSIFSTVGAKIIVAAAVSSTILIGVVLYQYCNNDNSILTSKIEIKIDSIHTKDQVVIIDKVEKNLQSNLNIENKKSFDQPKENTRSLKMSQLKAQNLVASTSKTDFQVQTPQLSDDFNQDLNSNSDLDIPTEHKSLVTGNSVNKKEIGIETIKDSRYPFHYKYIDHTVFLYGTFDQNPYELIDFRSDSNKDMYLYYNNAFYLLKNNQKKPISLSKIEDLKLISKLNKSR